MNLISGKLVVMAAPVVMVRLRSSWRDEVAVMGQIDSLVLLLDWRNGRDRAGGFQCASSETAVLAELTQPFDQPDVAYFFPLMAATEKRLGFRPHCGAFDAAFDAFYVYEYFDHDDGFAAVPFSERGGHKDRQFNPEGLPLCAAGLAMPLRYTFTDRSTLVEHERGRYVCPLLFPTATGGPCPLQHKKWKTGGCVTTLPTSRGARLRYQVDRQAAAYKAVYQQRTTTERINSQAAALQIERPKLRNGQASPISIRSSTC